MNYYKPTSFFQKVWKLIRLFFLFYVCRWSSKTRPARPAALSVLMAVPTIDRVGGLEIQAKLLASSLAESGQLVTVVTDRIDHSVSRDFLNGYLLHRIPKRQQRGMPLMISLFRFMNARRRQYHILHAHGFSGFSLFAIRFARRLKVPVVMIAQTKNDVSTIFAGHGLKHRMYQSWLRSVNKFIAISHELQQEMISCGIDSSRIERIPNFVVTSRFTGLDAPSRTQLRARLGAAEGQMVFLYLGRLVERKGAHILLRAWQEIGSGALWIVGEGDQEMELKQLASKLNLRNVKFHGKTTTPSEFYQAADVFVLPSLEEGLPTVLLEAMSSSLPCIATRIGGVTDVLQNDREGLMIAPGSVQELSEAINRMMSQPENRERWGHQARQTAIEKFDLAGITSRYIHIYKSLLPGT